MDQALLREIATQYLVPLFSGSFLEQKAEISSGGDALVAYQDGGISIAFKAEKKDRYRLKLTRSQPFTIGLTQNVVSEISVVRAFIDSLKPMILSLNSPSLRHDLLSTFPRRIVAKAMSSQKEREETLLLGIDQLTKWSATRYEGSPISATIGFRHLPQEEGVPTLSEISERDFSAVLSNGHDTLLDFDFKGRFISHGALSSDLEEYPYCPLRQTR